MKYLILTRPLSVKELSLARYINPLESQNRVIHLYKDENLMLEFICDMVTYSSDQSQYFEHLLTRHYQSIQPSDLYYHFIDHDAIIPVSYICRYDGYRFTHVEKTTGNALKKLVQDVMDL